MKVKNEIIIKDRLKEVFEITNDVRNWPLLFKNYTKVEILEEDENSIKFRLFMNDGQKEISWISLRKTDRKKFSVEGERLDPIFPFDYMKLKWYYEQVKEGTKLSWEQEFIPSKSLDPADQKRLIEHMLNSPQKELQYIKERYERMVKKEKDKD